MNNIIIGNLISFVAATFVAASCLVNNRKTIFFLQFLNNAVLAVAALFFGAYSSITTLVICSVRNIVIVKNRFDKKAVIITILLVTAAGLTANNRGLLGLLPILCAVRYTICIYLFTDVKRTRINILIDQITWAIYSFLILDICSALTSLVVAAVDIVSMIKEKRNPVLGEEK